jgi:hypothetical protein
MQIELTNNYCKIKMDDNGRVREKIVDLSELLDQLSVFRATNFGILPQGIRICESLGNEMIIGLQFPKKTWRLRFQPVGEDEQIFDNVSLPSGILVERIMRVSSSEFQHVSTSIFATRGNRIMFNHDRLYKFPTPNVYDGGKVCWGNVSLGNIQNISAVEGVVSSFFANKFNNDLFYGKLNPAYTGPVNAKDYFKLLTEDEFNDDWLVETPIQVGKLAASIFKD